MGVSSGATQLMVTEERVGKEEIVRLWGGDGSKLSKNAGVVELLSTISLKIKLPIVNSIVTISIVSVVVMLSPL